MAGASGRRTRDRAAFERGVLDDMRRVTAFHAGEGSHYECELNDGRRLPVGRERWKLIKTRLR